MAAIANVPAMLGMDLLRFGGRGGAGFFFLLLMVLVLGVVAYALTRPNRSV